MTQIALKVAVATNTPAPKKGPCSLCGKTHANNKEDDIKSPGWKRQTIKGLGIRHKNEKKTIYPGNTSPPAIYNSSGHHCVALSAFINTKKVDKNLKLNHFLDKAGYDPNNLDNCIDLPSCKKGDVIFPEFEMALSKAKPLQIHIGKHVKGYFNHCNTLTQDLFNFFTELDECKEPEKKWLDDLHKAMQLLEDEAFQKTAAAQRPFMLHPTPLREAEDIARSKGLGPINYPQLKIWAQQ